VGTRSGGDVLRADPARAALLEALPEFDRLVLLGDVLELRHGPLRGALEAADPLLREIGAALGSGREVVIVPGNHDHHLAGPWLGRRARESVPAPLGLESTIELNTADALSTLAERLAPARVRATYPGVWLREDVYATHGHYADRHTTVPMLERLSAGLMARVVGERDGGPRRAEDYEAELAPMYAWIDAVAQAGGARFGKSGPDPSTRAWGTLTDGRRRGLRQRALVLGFPVVVGALNRLGLGPLNADLSAPQLRRAGLRAFVEVLDRLEVTAPYAIFGHTHRAGPLPGDDRSEWVTAGGTEIVNTGCWLHEPRFMGSDPGRSPYRPGFAAVVERGGPPRLVNLLDEAGREADPEAPNAGAKV
jgi:hypothetical protein